MASPPDPLKLASRDWKPAITPTMRSSRAVMALKGERR